MPGSLDDKIEQTVKAVAEVRRMHAEALVENARLLALFTGDVKNLVNKVLSSFDQKLGAVNLKLTSIPSSERVLGFKLEQRIIHIVANSPQPRNPTKYVDCTLIYIENGTVSVRYGEIMEEGWSVKSMSEEEVVDVVSRYIRHVVERAKN